MFVIPQQELAASNAPFADLFARVLGGHYGEIVAAFVIVSGLGVLNGWTLMAGEVVQCMGRHGGFPAALGRENGHGAPARALLLTGAVTSVMLLTNYTDSIAKVFSLLIVIATAGTLPLYLASALALIVTAAAGPAAGDPRARRLAAHRRRGSHRLLPVGFDRHRHRAVAVDDRPWRRGRAALPVVAARSPARRVARQRSNLRLRRLVAGRIRQPGRGEPRAPQPARVTAATGPSFLIGLIARHRLAVIDTKSGTFAYDFGFGEGDQRRMHAQGLPSTPARVASAASTPKAAMNSGRSPDSRLNPGR